MASSQKYKAGGQNASEPRKCDITAAKETFMWLLSQIFPKSANASMKRKGDLSRRRKNSASPCPE